MSESTSSIVKQNEAARTFAANPVGVFVGGTSGIGLNAAYAFAKHTPSPTLYIIGRNKEAGAAAVNDIKELNNQANAVFLSHDMSLVEEADKLCEEISQKENKVNFLCLSTGFLSVSGRDETSEGIDKKMAVNYYTRFRVVEKLISLVQNAADLKEPARVVNVLAAGSEGKMQEDDIDLKHHYSLRNVNKHFVTLTSLATERFAKLYPSIGFSHIYPGLVQTGIGRSLPAFIRVPLTPIMWFGESGQDAGEKVFYLGYSAPKFSSGPHLLNSKLQSVRENALQYLSPELQEKAWTHTEEMYRKATGA